MDDPSYRAKGWQLGSGPVAAGCKAVIGQRLQGAGMRWSLLGADGVAHLRALFLSERGQWAAYWTHRQTTQPDALPTYVTLTPTAGRLSVRVAPTSRRPKEWPGKPKTRAGRIRSGEISVRDADLPKQERRPLEDHIQAFEAMLRAKRSTPKHIHMATRFIRKIARLAGAETAAELTQESVTRAVLSLQRDDRSARTINSYLRGVKSFTRWPAKPEVRRLREDALAGMSMLNEDIDRRRIRRPLTADEAAKLIQAAESGPVVMGMAGPHRAILYAVMLATGLRKSEVGSFVPGSFSLDGEPATLAVEASYSKRRRRDTLPLPSSLARRIRGWLAGKPEGKPVFALPDQPHKMFYRDLAVAKIPQKTSAGVLDLHSTRHTFVSEIVAGGANVKTAKSWPAIAPRN